MDKSVLIVILLVLGVILILLWIWWKKLETVDDNNIDRNRVIGNNSYYNTGNTPGPRFVRTIVYTNYREVRQRIVNQIAFNEVVRGKSNSEIYTKQYKPFDSDI